MTIEEIWENITVLENKSYTNGAYGIFLLGITGLLEMLLIILSPMAGFNIDFFTICSCLDLSSIALLCSIIAIIGYAVYANRPEKVELHISIDTHCISIEELKKYFKLSKVSYNKHFVTCNIKPKRKYYNDVDSLVNRKDISK